MYILLTIILSLLNCIMTLSCQTAVIRGSLVIKKLEFYSMHRIHFKFLYLYVVYFIIKCFVLHIIGQPDHFFLFKVENCLYDCLANYVYTLRKSEIKF